MDRITALALLGMYLLALSSCDEKTANEESATVDMSNWPAKTQRLAQQVDSTQAALSKADEQEKPVKAKELVRQYQNLNKAIPKDADAGVFLFKEAMLQQQTLGNYDEAFGLYDAIIEEHPSSKLVPDAKFHRAMIIHRVYGDTTKAKALFKAFVESYPDHEQTPMAKQMLQYANVPADKLWERIKDSVDKR